MDGYMGFLRWTLMNDRSFPYLYCNCSIQYNNCWKPVDIHCCFGSSSTITISQHFLNFLGVTKLFSNFSFFYFSLIVYLMKTNFLLCFKSLCIKEPNQGSHPKTSLNNSFPKSCRFPLSILIVKVKGSACL